MNNQLTITRANFSRTQMKQTWLVTTPQRNRRFRIRSNAVSMPRRIVSSGRRYPSKRTSGITLSWWLKHPLGIDRFMVPSWTSRTAGLSSHQNAMRWVMPAENPFARAGKMTRKSLSVETRDKTRARAQPSGTGSCAHAGTWVTVPACKSSRLINRLLWARASRGNTVAFFDPAAVAVNLPRASARGGGDLRFPDSLAFGQVVFNSARRERLVLGFESAPPSAAPPHVKRNRVTTYPPTWNYLPGRKEGRKDRRSHRPGPIASHAIISGARRLSPAPETSPFFGRRAFASSARARPPGRDCASLAFRSLDSARGKSGGGRGGMGGGRALRFFHESMPARFTIRAASAARYFVRPYRWV